MVGMTTAITQEQQTVVAAEMVAAVVKRSLPLPIRDSTQIF
jgi:hypothetical protein